MAKIEGKIIPLIRAGYPAAGSNWKQHHFFHDWALLNLGRFDILLREGERCVGEWLMEAHGTLYTLPHEPFVVFDIMIEHTRKTADEVRDRCGNLSFVTPQQYHVGGPISIAEILSALEPSKHGAESVEGAVWRCERKGVVDFLGKYVRPDKVDGKYLENVTGNAPIYNWQPS